MSTHPQILDHSDQSWAFTTSFGAQWDLRSYQETTFHNTLLVCRVRDSEPPPGIEYADRPWLRVKFNGTGVRLIGRPTRTLRMNYTLESGEVPDDDGAPPQRTRATEINFSDRPDLLNRVRATR